MHFSQSLGQVRPQIRAGREVNPATTEVVFLPVLVFRSLSVDGASIMNKEN